MELIAIAGLAILVGAAIALWRRRTTGTALLLEATTAFRLGDGEEGERAFEQLQSELHGYRDRLRAAEALAAARAYEHALKLVVKGLELRPNADRLVRLRAILAAKMVRHDARRLLTDYLEEHDKDSEVRLELAALHLRLRNLDDATALLEVHLERIPDSARGRSMLGRAHFHASRFDEAKRELQAAQKLRDRGRRQVMPMYDMPTARGYDMSVAAEELWNEEEDLLLLDQIESGDAEATIASVQD